jgi:hypothetical protein
MTIKKVHYTVIVMLMQVELIMEKMPNLLTQQIRDMTNLDCY